MFTAINKKTEQMIYSINLIDNIKYQFPKEEEWYADPNNIESYDKELVQDIKKIKVVYVSEKKIINFRGTQFAVSPHFRIPNASKLGINVIPESREHKLAKNWIYNKLVGNNDIQLCYSTIKKPYEYNNMIKFSELPIDKNKVGIEISILHGVTRRVDVLVPFLKRHHLFGNGICFEIQFSIQRQKTEDRRTIDRVLQGFSVVWLHETDFEEIGETFIELKSKIVKVDSFLTMINKEKKMFVKTLKFEVQEQFRLLELEKRNTILEINERLSELNKQFDEIIGNKINECNVPNMIDHLIESKIGEIQETLKNPKTIDCPNCGGLMIYSEGISKQGRRQGRRWKTYKCIQNCGVEPAWQ